MAKWPRNVTDIVTEYSRAAQMATRSLNRRRLIVYSSPVVASISTRLRARAAARPPMLSAHAPATG